MPAPKTPLEFEENIPNPSKQSVCQEIVGGVFKFREDVLAFYKWMFETNDPDPVTGVQDVQFSQEFEDMVCAVLSTCTTVSTSTTTTTTTPGTLTTTTTLTTTSTSTGTTTTQAIISIVDFATAVPYPSQRTISGRTGTITKVVVTLTHLTHGSTFDIRMLLVAPDGTMCKLMDHCGGLNGATNVTLTLDQSAGQALPHTTPIVTGTYRPADFNTTIDMPAPAPSGPYSVDLSVFNGLSANGDWKLYIADDKLADNGSLQDWSLAITTA